MDVSIKSDFAFLKRIQKFYTTQAIFEKKNVYISRKGISSSLFIKVAAGIV